MNRYNRLALFPGQGAGLMAAAAFDSSPQMTVAQASAPGNTPAPANCIQVCPPSKDMVRPGRWSVNQTDMMECISQPLYSYQSYPAAGAATLTFFQTLATGSVTVEDTNMQAQGQLPAPQKFLIQGIGIDYLPGSSPIQGPRADSAQSQANDFWAIMRRGELNLTIGSKPYLDMAPLMSLPVRAHINGALAMCSSTTPAAALQTVGSYAFSDGDVFKPIPLLLEASQNFRVTIGFPGGAVAIPSADASARIGVILYGSLYRPPQ